MNNISQINICFFLLTDNKQCINYQGRKNSLFLDAKGMYVQSTNYYIRFK